MKHFVKQDFSRRHCDVNLAPTPPNPETAHTPSKTPTSPSQLGHSAVWPKSPQSGPFPLIPGHSNHLDIERR